MHRDAGECKALVGTQIMTGGYTDNGGSMRIRKAETGDIKELLDIYNYEVTYGVATLDIHPKTLEEWSAWFAAHNIENHPLYVAEAEGTGVGTGAGTGAGAKSRIAGYASLSAYREKEAYKSTVELSVYISPDYRRQGVATKLMQVILEEARRDESIHMVVSVITAGNEASVKLHEKYGFTFCGTIHEVGYKSGKYQDIENYELKVK